MSMDVWPGLVLPFALLLGRIGTFFMVLPLFSWRALPMRLRAALAILVTVFFAVTRPTNAHVADLEWTTFSVLMVQEVLHGLALGLTVSLIFLAVQQGARMIGMSMGLGDAGIIDPVTRERARPLDRLFEVTFALLFLSADGHHQFILLMARSYEAFPMGSGVDVAAQAGALVQAGTIMLTLALKLAAPMLAAFLILAVVLAILARVLPEMNVLLISFPLRVGLGLFMAATIVSSLDFFASEIGDWIRKIVIV